MTNHLAAAKVLDELLLELIEKGAAIPAQVAEELKAGRALAGIGLRKPDDAELAAKAGVVLEGVEMNLLSQAEITGGAAYADAWQERILAARARERPSEAAAAYVNRMVKGVPKGEHWIRLQTSELADADPAAFGLTAAAQEDGFTLVYGKKESVTAFLNEIRQKEIHQNGKVGFQRNS